ncbi:flagellar hook-basal body complex protein [Massilia sp. CCM 8695]|uniref:Flagellar hook protein FlgE n=1 Tax=Massilia frigida TaxID=2609281 RepID=A0ABX0NFI1_9BURK|nr:MULTISPECIES: flagellar hook-basal body complex protein [Massilia]MDM5179185.1 flagellar hook-basal body complex protein [Massilia sp. DJPM01]NHZ80768.1 flagellar hook-basal body complex protein [Massilia frigida]
MINTINTGMSGLIGYSKGLQVIGNNLTNINTPGYKGVDQQFASLFSQEGAQNGTGTGSGLNTLDTRVNFSQGQINQTGRPLDLAINGLGFFILRDGDTTTYTRAGQFEFDADGILVSSDGKSRVAGLGPGGMLQDISLSGLQNNAGKATTSIKFDGNLSANATADVTVGPVNIFDAAGGQHTLALTFSKTASVPPATGNNWTVTAKDETGTVVGTGPLQFSTTGSPQITANAVQLNFTPKGMAPMSVKLDFSSGVTSVTNGSSSSLKSGNVDGFAIGSLRSQTFDADGVLTLNYSNGEAVKGVNIALANFDRIESLDEISGNKFTTQSTAHIGKAGTSLFGTIGAGVVEGANVDLSQQFSNLIIMQRGYQASSQIVSVSNEMIQTLLDMRK